MILKCALLSVLACLAFAQDAGIDNAFADYERAWANADKEIVARLAAEDLV